MRNINELQITAAGMLIDPQTGSRFKLNQTARQIVTALQAQQSEQHILNALQQAYSHHNHDLVWDFNAFLRALHALGFGPSVIPVSCPREAA